METNSEALADRLAVQDVIARYAACLDDRAFARYRDCFWPEIELHGFTPDPVRGVEAWLEFVRKTLERFAATQHMLGPPLVLVSRDSAEMRTDLQAQHFYREPAGRIFTLWGTYRSGLERRGGSWRMLRHELLTRATRVSDAYRT